MTEHRTKAWIFNAMAMASQVEPADFRAISMIADGIEHAIPTHKELQTSLKWLVEKGLATKTNNRYRLSEKGKMEYDSASAMTSGKTTSNANIESVLGKYWV